jgi:high-affinity iron transporter
VLLAVVVTSVAPKGADVLASSLITLREGLEAALIVGIVLGYLRKTGHLDRQASVWAGVASALLVSLAAALALNAIGAGFSGRGEQIFEGVAMALAAGILTWMIFWMQRQSRQIRGDLEAGVRRAVEAGAAGGLFWLAFVAVVREGLETALFLTAAVFTATAADTVIGGVIGLLLAIVIGWLIYLGTTRLPVATFFQVTGAVLVVFAAGLVANAVGEFQEAGLLPGIVEHLWSTAAWLDDNSTLGSALHSLVGYASAPSLLQVLAYVTYYLGLWLGFQRATETTASEKTPA